MKRLIVLLVLAMATVSYAGVGIDISGSQYETKTSNTMRIRNMDIQGYPGKYWVDFMWNQFSMSFVPITAGLEPQAPPATLFFSYDDFANKSLYYAGSGIYQLCKFNPDGTAIASNIVAFGTPTLNPDNIAWWSVEGGELVLKSGDTTIRYALISDDKANRYYRANQYSPNGIIKIVRLYYDQTTGLSQTQAFTASNQQP